jgi:hypothetical protein
VIACADGNDSASELAWAAWGPEGATARGTFHVNDCIPYCVDGTFHSFPGTLTLSRPIWCDSLQSWVYTKLRQDWTRPVDGRYGYTERPVRCPSTETAPSSVGLGE